MDLDKTLQRLTMKKPSGAGRWQPQVCKEWDACQLAMRQLGEFLWRTKEK